MGKEGLLLMIINSQQNSLIAGGGPETFAKRVAAVASVWETHWRGLGRRQGPATPHSQDTCPHLLLFLQPPALVSWGSCCVIPTTNPGA